MAPWLIPSLLALGVLLVNGWTDAPNAIATAVSTHALSYPKAAALAAVCNLAGCLTAGLWWSGVSATVLELADFGSGSAALTALCAAMAAVILWAALAWRLGLPTSESHALLAGLSGGAVALRGDFTCLNLSPWRTTLLGLVLSLVLGYLLSRRMGRFLPRRLPYRALQTAGAALMAFAHGAQDGQKFLGVLLLASGLSGGAAGFSPAVLSLLCAGVMAAGTAAGGRRIVDTMGQDLVSLSPRTGFAADLAAGLCLLLSTLLGAPVSTTHTKAAAILGTGSTESRTNHRTVRSLLLAWGLTFPVCFALAGGLTQLLTR